MQYAIIKLSGKQYKVKKGDIVQTEKLNFKKGEKVSFDDVFLVFSNGNVIVGTPKIEGAFVRATVLDHTKGEKIRVAKFKAKVRYRRVTGKRQNLTSIKIEEIVSRSTPKKAVKTPKKVPLEKRK